MDFQWIAIALGDVAWISIAFVLGLLSRSVGLPPLVGFLATGFLLNAYGIASGEMLEKLSDLGITLLLFTVGLKLNLRTLARPQVWAVSRATEAGDPFSICLLFRRWVTTVQMLVSRSLGTCLLLWPSANPKPESETTLQ